MTAGSAVERPRGPYGKRKTKAARDAESVRAFELRAMGHTTYAIAAEMGISVQTVCERIEAARGLLLAPKVEEARELSMRTLEAARLKLLQDWGKLQESADQSNGPGKGKIEHSPKFAEALTKIEDRMAKLQGLDRPVLIEASVTVTHEGGIDGELADLAAQLGLNDPEPDQTPADDQQGSLA